MEADINAILKNPDEYKWLTSESISKKLFIDRNNTPEQIEQILINIVKSNPDSSIRYSTLPSKRNLTVLWGHKDRVGDRKLFDIFKEDEQTNPTYLNDIDDVRNMFLSHSFKDTKAVFSLSRQLVKYGFNPWVAEADISRGHHINNEVIHALKDLPFFGIYVSKNVIKSAWSAKEFQFALRNKRKLIAFIPEDETEIIELIEHNIPIDHMDVHDLLRRLFDTHEISEHIDFFLISDNNNLVSNKMKLIKDIHSIL